MAQVFTTLNRVSTVSMDAMFTMFQPQINGRPATRKQIEGRIYRCTAGIEPNKLSNEMIHQIVEEEREKMPLRRDDQRYWRLLNTEVFRKILAIAEAPKQRFHHAAHYAVLAHQKFLSSEEYWFIQPSMHDFLRRLRKQGIRVIIASNHHQESLSKLMKHDGKILEEVDAVYVSETFGVGKAFPEFWEQLIAAEKRVNANFDPATLVHIGNSPRSDIGACDLDIPFVVYDRERVLTSFRQLEPEQLASIVFADNIDEAVAEQDGPTIIKLSEQQRKRFLDQYQLGKVVICNTVPELRSTVLPLAA
ncbi:MAG: HAD family hydrolase [Patescibacteria group bacterium]